MPNLEPRTTVAICDCPLCGADYPFNVTSAGNKLMATCVDRRCSSQFKVSTAESQAMMKDYIANDRQPVEINLKLERPTIGTKPKAAPQPKDPASGPGTGPGDDRNIAGERIGAGTIFDAYDE